MSVSPRAGKGSPSFDKDSISKGILDHLMLRENDIINYNKVHQDRIKYAKSNSFKKLSFMLNNIIKAYENDNYS